MVVIIEPELALRRVLVLDRGKVVRSWSGSLQGPASLGPPLVSRTTGAAEVNPQESGSAFCDRARVSDSSRRPRPQPRRTNTLRIFSANGG